MNTTSSPGLFDYVHLSDEIANRLSTMMYRHRTTSSSDFSPTGDYRRGESLSDVIPIA